MTKAGSHLMLLAFYRTPPGIAIIRSNGFAEEE